MLKQCRKAVFELAGLAMLTVSLSAMTLDPDAPELSGAAEWVVVR